MFELHAQADLKRKMDLNEHLLQADHLDVSLRRFFVDEFYTRHASRLSAGSHVLDLGGHKSPKRGRFNIEEHELQVRYANLSASHRPDVQADAAMLPFKDESFDVVVCAETLEHVLDPVRVMREVYRVLRRQGILLMTVPFLFPIHADPYDYCRYTDHYWREHLQKVGFLEVAVEEQGLFWSVVVDMVRAWFYERTRRGRPRSHFMQNLIAAIIAKGKRFALNRERTASADDHAFIKRYTTGYGIRVVRP